MLNINYLSGGKLKDGPYEEEGNNRERYNTNINYKAGGKSNDRSYEEEGNNDYNKRSWKI